MGGARPSIFSIVFFAGAECLGEIEFLGRDAGLRRVLGESMHHPKSLGNFLRTFSVELLRRMNQG
jgi:hypothetical protein